MFLSVGPLYRMLTVYMQPVRGVLPSMPQVGICVCVCVCVSMCAPMYVCVCVPIFASFMYDPIIRSRFYLIYVIVSIYALTPLCTYLQKHIHTLRPVYLYLQSGFEDDLFPIRTMPQYLGTHCGSYVFGFLYILICTFAVFFICVFLRYNGLAALDRIIHQYGTVLWTITCATIIKCILIDLVVYEYYCTDGTRVKRTAPFAFCTVALTLYNVISGGFLAYIRVFLLSLHSIHLIFQYDYSHFPGIIRVLDAPYGSYWATVQYERVHNNDKVIAGSAILADGIARKEEGGRDSNPGYDERLRKLRAKNRWRLAYTLIQNPSVVRYRVTKPDTNSPRSFQHPALRIPSARVLPFNPALTSELGIEMNGMGQAAPNISSSSNLV